MSPLLLGAGKDVAAKFLPSDYPNLVIWLTAHDLGLADAAGVAAWPNKGSGPDFSQALGGQQPSYRQNVKNGLGVVRFDGGNDNVASDSGITLAQPSSWYAVMIRNGNLTAFNRVIWSPTSQGEMGFDDEADMVYSYAGQAVTFPDEPATDLAWHIVSARMLDDDSILRVDGIEGSGDVGSGSWSSATVTIGAAAASLSGDLGEVIIYSGQHTAAQITTVERYLEAKWRIVLL